MTDINLPNNQPVKVKKTVDINDDEPQYLATNIIKPIYKINGFLGNNGYVINKKKYHKFIIDFLKIYFHAIPKQDFVLEDADIGFDVFTENAKYLFLPKFVSDEVISRDNDDKQLNLIYINDDGSQITITNIVFSIKSCIYDEPIAIDVNFKGVLRDYQQAIVNNIYEKFNNSINLPKGGIVSLSCGGGKTIIAINLLCGFKKKTLIVAYQSFLINQWIQRITEFTNCRIGQIRGNIIDIEDKDVVVASLKSLSVKNYDKNLFKQFGLVIYDEVHRFGSKIYSQALKKTQCSITIGLSATVNRKDKMEKLIHWYIGKILYKMERRLNYKILVKKIYFRSNSDKFVECKTRIKGCKDPLPNNAKMLQNLCELESRNKVILNIINRLKDDDRKIFVFSSRVEHLILLKNMFDAVLKKNNEFLELGKKDDENDEDDNMLENRKKKIITSLYYAKTSEIQRQIMADTSSVIFITLQIASEGLDISRLDTIVYALPYNRQSKNIVQSAGRILRSQNLDNYLKIPLIIDISDILSIYSSWSKVRDEVYLKKRWYVQEYYYNDNNFIHTPENANLEPLDIMFNDIKDEEFITDNLILEDGDENDEEFEEVDDRENMFDF